MAAPVPLRSDFDAEALRGLTKGSRDPAQTRRLLALSVIAAGGLRSEAAEIGGVGLQAVEAMTQQAVPLPAARMLTKAQAASYCGLSMIVFQRECDVRPIRFGADTVQRYDRLDLDAWIGRHKGGPDARSFDEWLELLDNGKRRAR